MTSCLLNGNSDVETFVLILFLGVTVPIPEIVLALLSHYALGGTALSLHIKAKAW